MRWVAWAVIFGLDRVWPVHVASGAGGRDGGSGDGGGGLAVVMGSVAFPRSVLRKRKCYLSRENSGGCY